MPTDVDIRQYIHGGTNEAQGETNHNSAYAPWNSLNTGHHDVEYLMPIVESTAHTWDGANSWGLEMYGNSSDGNEFYSNNYSGNTNYILCKTPGKAVWRIGAYFWCSADAVGNIANLYLFGVDSNGDYSPGGAATFGFGTRSNTSYVDYQAASAPYGQSSKKSTQKNPAGDTTSNGGTQIGGGIYGLGQGNGQGNRSFYAIHFRVDQNPTWHEMYCYFNNPPFTVSGITCRYGTRSGATVPGNSTTFPDWTHDSDSKLFCDQMILEPYDIGFNKFMDPYNLYGDHSDISLLEVYDGAQ